MKEAPSAKGITRRRFLKTTSTAFVGGAVLGGLPLGGMASAGSQNNDARPQNDVTATAKQRLLTGWDHHRASLGGVWEVWRKSANDVNLWPPVTLPHCFNASDAVDPDTAYYQGPGWYRTKLKIKNPYQNGRTLLHFEGAGQKTEVFVYTEKVGSHVGGYDEFTLDISDAVARYSKRPAEKDDKDKGLIPIAVMCDNTRDLEMIPSNLSDFNLYGGLYRLAQFREGDNELRAVGKKDGKEVSDAIKFSYQTQEWGKPAKLSLQKLHERGEAVTIEARLLDSNGVLCLDARNVVRFNLIGEGYLIDNLGTSTAARKLELYNGRAQISLEQKGEVVVSVSSEGMKPAFLTLGT